MNSIELIENIDQIKDLSPLILLVQQQISSYNGNSDYNRIEAAILNALKSQSRSVFVLWNDYKGRLGAFAFANVCSGLESGSDYLWINELYVDEMFRKRGVASEILKYIEKWSVEKEIVYIACSTSLENKSAQQVYKKNGFELNKTMWVDKNV